MDCACCAQDSGFEVNSQQSMIKFKKQQYQDTVEICKYACRMPFPNMGSQNLDNLALIWLYFFEKGGML